MKRIGVLYSKGNNKLFLLPNDIEQLVQAGITVTILSGAGNCININDTELLSAGAKIANSWKEVIENSDVILKVEAFNKKELKEMGNKIAITMVNYLTNVDMIYHMLLNKTTSFQWNALINNGQYVFFPSLEELKAPLIFKFMNDAFVNGLAKKEKNKVVYPKNPKLLILNATFVGVALAKIAINAGYEVTIADNDTKYLNDLKSMPELSNIKTINSHYETLVEEVKTNNVLVATTTNPIDIAKTRITKNMAETMPKGSLLIDAGCEYGYTFQFIKKYVDAKIKWNSIGNSYYLAFEDLTNLNAKEASKIISNNSTNYLMELVKNETFDQQNQIIICKDGKVLSPFINSKLRLY